MPIVMSFADVEFANHDPCDGVVKKPALAAIYPWRMYALMMEQTGAS